MRVYRFPHVAAFYSSCRAFCHECRSLIGFPPHNSVIVAKLCTLLNKRTAASWRFRSVCEKDLDILKQLDYSLSISMRDSLLGPSSTTNFLTCFVFKIQLRRNLHIGIFMDLVLRSSVPQRKLCSPGKPIRTLPMY